MKLKPLLSLTMLILCVQGVFSKQQEGQNLHDFLGYLIYTWGVPNLSVCEELKERVIFWTPVSNSPKTQLLKIVKSENLHLRVGSHGYILCGLNLPRRITESSAKGTFRFEDTPLDLALRVLFSSMQVQFIIPGNLAGYRVSGDFHDTPVHEILTVFHRLYPIEISRNGSIYVVKEKSSK